MLDGFGQAPICIELDLDSYDGPWTHVERFRGRSGWLVVAEAHLTAADAEWETTLVAACDDYGEPVPPFMAPNLLACACSHPLPCRELPPNELDELLNAAAHELRLSWLRDTNRHLHDLSRAGADRVAAMEAATRAEVDEADRQVADLRRRRRMPGVTPHAIGLFNETITEIEVDREAALHRLAEERAKVRRAVEQEEMTLLRRTSVKVTWEPLYQVSWSAAGRSGEDGLAVREHVTNARSRAGGFAYAGTQLSRNEPNVASRPKRAVVLPRSKAAPSLNPVGTDPPTGPAAELPNTSQAATASTFVGVSAPVPTLANRIFDTPMSVTTTPTSLAPAVSGKLKAERDKLVRQLGEVEETGSKFLRGSPKFERNRQQRVELAERIHALDAELAQPGVPPATAVSSFADQRAELEAELARHQNRGALLSDGATRYRQYRDRRLYLLGCIAELNQRIARQAARKEHI